MIASTLPAELASSFEKVAWIPLRGDSKTPAVKWKCWQSERPDIAQLQRWQDELAPDRWAIVTGAVSGVVVADFDGEAGAHLCAALGLSAHVTTPSGGCHVYFDHPGFRVPTLTSNANPFLGEHFGVLDVKGDGGYAVALAEGYRWTARGFKPDPWGLLP